MLNLGLPQSLVRDWLIPFGIERVETMAGGLSGGWVGKCMTANRETYALKRWPEGVTQARVAEVHRVVRYAASRGCGVVALVFLRENGLIDLDDTDRSAIRLVPASPCQHSDDR